MEDVSVVADARRAAEQLPVPPARPDVVGAHREHEDDDKAAAAPPVLELLLYHEEERAAARASGDVRLANRALVDVVRDLDVLLDSTEEHLRQTGDRRSRQRVRDAVPRLVAISAVAVMPLAVVAGFLDLPPDRVDAVVASLARHGDLDPAGRRRALQQVQWLRNSLRQVEVTEDHSLLDRVLAFVSKFALLGFVALASAAAGAFSVGESVVKEVVKTAVIALVAAALQASADHVRARRDGQTRRAAAQAAHAALLADLAVADSLWAEPAYEGEHAVTRVRLAVRACAARITSVPLDWPDKWQYWDLLDDVAAALDRATPAELRSQVRRLRAFGPPA
ncbi:hypothetical protein AB0G02_27900 [Actinosynnema sp. NPDC023658]|uniref:hypothetical protein n=1 Tax=Actinosynnema sp. NPDC023658 TaxID=3155465 RepID=UPI0033C7945D